MEKDSPIVHVFPRLVIRAELNGEGCHVLIATIRATLRQDSKDNFSAKQVDSHVLVVVIKPCRPCLGRIYR